MAVIYKITNPNNHVYVGSTKSTVNQRKAEHKYMFSNSKNNHALHNSFDKYGFDNHTFEEIVQVDDDDRFELEHFIIQEFNTKLNTVKEYNKTASGKVWVNDGIKEFQVYPDQTEGYVLGRVGEYGKWNKGKKRTDKVKQTMSKSRGRIILAYKNNEFIGEYRSAAEAGRVLGIDRHSITKVARDINKSAKGFKFKYKI